MASKKLGRYEQPARAWELAADLVAEHELTVEGTIIQAT